MDRSISCPQGPAAGGSHGMKTLCIGFGHGLGDCANFAHVVRVYQARGYDVRVHYEKNKEALWRAVGVSYVDPGRALHHPWLHPARFYETDGQDVLAGSKIAGNLNTSPLPAIGERDVLWQAICAVRLTCAKVVSEVHTREAERFLAPLARPIIALHTTGTNCRDCKNIPDVAITELYDRLLDDTGGSLVVLDWDNRVPTLASGRVRHLSRDWGHIDLERLWCLIQGCDLLVGVDSGPYHFARFTDTPVLGVWGRHLPNHCALPRAATVNLVGNGHGLEWAQRRADWNIVEAKDTNVSMADVTRQAVRILQGPRYGIGKERLGRDIQLQHWVRDRMRGRDAALSRRVDRDVTFDLVLENLGRSRREPVIVETGCVRARDDWGAGLSTVVLSAFVDALGRGSVETVDNNGEHIRMARELVGPSGGRTRFHNSDSVSWLSGVWKSIDLLYLDSMDTDLPGHAEHCLRETQAAMHNLRPGSLVMIDDTPWVDGSWRGKGAQAVPWLLGKGFRMVASGYQVLLEAPGKG